MGPLDELLALMRWEVVGHGEEVGEDGLLEGGLGGGETLDGGLEFGGVFAVAEDETSEVGFGAGHGGAEILAAGGEAGFSGVECGVVGWGEVEVLVEP